MRCPNCNQPTYIPTEACPVCQFTGDPARLELLGHLDWLLDELETWADLGLLRAERAKIEARYIARQFELEVELGLRPPPFSHAEAETAWSDLARHEVLLAKIKVWLQAGWLEPHTTQRVMAEIGERVDYLLDRLAGHTRPDYPQIGMERLALTNFLLDSLPRLQFTTPEAKAGLTAELEAEKAALVTALRPTSLSTRLPGQLVQRLFDRKTEAQPPDVSEITAEDPPPPSPPPPALPWRERMWRSLLSERTLQAILSLGIFLIFVGAISFVVRGWENFSPPLRMAIPTSVTIIFFFLGRYVRRRTTLYRSGMALSAVAALLAPIDFYTVYVSLNIPAGYGPSFWLGASVVCLVVYTAATLIIQSRFFGYLVAAAAGSSLLALLQILHQLVDLSLDWRAGVISLLAWGLILVASRLERMVLPVSAITTRVTTLETSEALEVPEALIEVDEAGEVGPEVSTQVSIELADELSETPAGLSIKTDKSFSADNATGEPAGGAKTRVADRVTARSAKSVVDWQGAFVEPFRYLALLTLGVLMPLTFAWRYLDRPTYDTLHSAMTLTWWVGGFVFSWAAVHYRSRSLGLVAALSFPLATYLAQAALFAQNGLSPAWHALGLAGLTPFYFKAAHHLLAHKNKDEPALYAQGRLAFGWGMVLAGLAAIWSFDLQGGAAAAGSHTLLAATAIWVTWLWRDPRSLYATSLFSLSAFTFALTELGLGFDQLTPAWAALAILHLILALNLGRRLWSDLADQNRFLQPLVVAGYGLAGAAVLPAYIPYNGTLLAYAFGNWVGLAAWGARLAHLDQPGYMFAPQGSRTLWHWFTALPLPVWLWLLFSNAGPLEARFPLALIFLAWGMVALSYYFKRRPGAEAYYWPWYLSGGLVSLLALVAAFLLSPAGLLPALSLVVIGGLYGVDAFISRRAWLLAVGSVAIARGLDLCLYRLQVDFDAASFVLAALVGGYYLFGLWIEKLWLERRRLATSTPFTAQFLRPFYLTAHGLALIVLGRIYFRPLDRIFFAASWTEAMQVWGAASQLLLGGVYGLYAWGRYKERWGHLAAWLGAASGGFVALAYSQGRGSSAAKAALLAITFVLAERGLHWVWQQARQGGKQVTLKVALTRRRLAMSRLAWRLYKRPLLVAGWTISAGTIGLALIRNLWLLGGGPSQKFWTWLGLLFIAGLYALAARLFQQRRFVWLAALLVFAPWTILTNLGWYIFDRPVGTEYALSWTILAWGLFWLHLGLRRHYAAPIHSVSQGLLIFSLLWGLADVKTSCFTLALAIGLYITAAFLAWHRGRLLKRTVSTFQQTKFLYLAVGLMPVWAVYLLAWFFPAAPYEYYGLLLLLFGPVGGLIGTWLVRVYTPREPFLAIARGSGRTYGGPGYVTGILATIIGTLLVVHIPALLAPVLVFDALLLLIASYLFRNPVWLYPAGLLLPLALLITLADNGAPVNRYGWWLTGLAALYLAIAAGLRRLNLAPYGTATLIVGFVLIAVSLPPSSQDQIGAFWGYGAATILYLLTAIWLGQPLLLIPACALAVVPYAAGLQLSPLRPVYYGLALFPGTITALTLGWRLDRRQGAWSDFPWFNPLQWGTALAARWQHWWGLSFYTLGFGLAVASPFFTAGQAGPAAFNLTLLAPFFVWGIFQFRLRGWLLAAALALHLAVVVWFASLGWWDYPALAWFRFMPLTLLTILTALLTAHYLGEGSPLDPGKAWLGWSRPLYLLASADVMIAQLGSLSVTEAGAGVTAGHALLLAGLASWWLLRRLPYGSALLGIIAFCQWLFAQEGSATGAPVALAILALGYGLIGYGLALCRARGWPEVLLRPEIAIWELPLQRSSLGLSIIVLVLSAVLGIDLVGWTILTVLGLSFRALVDVGTVLMVVRVFSILGLLYLALAFIERRTRVGYGAIGMLLTAWMLYTLYVQHWLGLAWVQWYAIPAGLYLLAIAYLEWTWGHKGLARWIDYAALVLMIGSLFWQTLLFGWGYFWLLILEGLLAIWWASARRLRRFLYAGMVGVILAALGQLINSLWSINQWLVFGSIGLILVAIHLFLERKQADLQVWRDTLDAWE